MISILMQLTRSRVISHLFLFVSIQFGCSNMASLVCVSFMCLVQCLLVAHQLSSSFDQIFPPFFHSKISVSGDWFHWLESSWLEGVGGRGGG